MEPNEQLTEHLKFRGMRRLSPKRVWYHGTPAAKSFDEFKGSDAMAGSISLTSKFRNAKNWGRWDRGYFESTGEKVNPRIIASRVNLENNRVPIFVPAVEKYGLTREQATEHWRKVHEDARAITQEAGYQAYILDYRNDPDDGVNDLTVINPNEVEIASHNVSGPVSVLPKEHPAIRNEGVTENYVAPPCLEGSQRRTRSQGPFDIGG